LSSRDISVVIPAYNEEGSIFELHRRVSSELERLGRDFEIVFVDDGSTDGTLARMQKLMRKDPRIKVVTFWRNFGKANALSAGFKHVEGRIVFQMDADLQDDPKEFGRFLQKLDSGYDMVVGWKRRRHDPIGKRLPSKFFNHLIRRTTGIDIHDSNCGFKAYRREVLEHLDIYGEMHRYLPSIARWRGFRVGEIEVLHHARKFGKSKYGIERLLKGFLDLITVAYLTRYGRSPMHLFGAMSLVPFILSAAQVAYIVGDLILTGTSPERPLAVTAIMVAIWGFTVLTLGIIAEMLLLTVGPGRMVDSYGRLLEREK